MTYQKTLMPLGAPCWKLIKSMFFVSAGLAATSLSAYAQNSNDPFATERVPEEFRPTPIQLNSFLVVPYIDLETDVIDNVFISDEFSVWQHFLNKRIKVTKVRIHIISHFLGRDSQGGRVVTQ